MKVYHFVTILFCLIIFENEANNTVVSYSTAPNSLYLDCVEIVDQALAPLEVCDNDADSEVSFDLTDKQTEAINAISGTATNNITYHNTQADAETGDSSIGDPMDIKLNVAELPKNYFVRIIDTDDCANVVSFQVSFVAPPAIITPQGLKPVATLLL